MAEDQQWLEVEEISQRRVSPAPFKTRFRMIPGNAVSPGGKKKRK